MTSDSTTQAEQVLEDQLVSQLIGQGYAQVAVSDETSMLANLKAQLEAFNGRVFSASLPECVLHDR